MLSSKAHLLLATDAIHTEEGAGPGIPPLSPPPPSTEPADWGFPWAKSVNLPLLNKIFLQEPEAAKAEGCDQAHAGRLCQSEKLKKLSLSGVFPIRPAAPSCTKAVPCLSGELRCRKFAQPNASFHFSSTPLLLL